MHAAGLHHLGPDGIAPGHFERGQRAVRFSGATSRSRAVERGSSRYGFPVSTCSSSISGRAVSSHTSHRSRRARAAGKIEVDGLGVRVEQKQERVVADGLPDARSRRRAFFRSGTGRGSGPSPACHSSSVISPPSGRSQMMSCSLAVVLRAPRGARLNAAVLEELAAAQVGVLLADGDQLARELEQRARAGRPGSSRTN